MLRHACGYALANKGHDTRALQAYLGHKNIQHTVRYSELSPTRFKDFWRMAAGNVILGGVIGLGVDAATGAMNKYPDVVTVSMTPDPSCRQPPPNRPPPPGRVPQAYSPPQQ